jgi:prepilin signal peptidase PulO-like enzyme (type II secretory pathway)
MMAESMLAALAGTLAAAVVDVRTGLIPDGISRGTALVALALAAADGLPLAAFGGAAAVGGMLLTLHLMTNGRGLGLGDVKLGVAIGTGFGLSLGVVALGVAFVIGGAYAVGLLATGRAQRGDAIRFGPFLATGAFAAALAPPEWFS